MSATTTTATASRAPAGEGLGLGYETLLEPRLVYRLAPEQVVTTDWHRDPESSLFTVAVRVPLAHARFSDTATPHADVVLLAEATNQAGVVVASNLLGVPLETQFLVRRFAVRLEPLEHNVVGRDKVRLALAQTPDSTFRARPGGHSTRAVLRTANAFEGRHSGATEVAGLFVAPEVYAGLRERVPTSREAPPPRPVDADRELRTGRLDPRNSVVTPVRPGREPGSYASEVLVDVDDPTFFDRPLDHVPGLLLFEAARQAATAAACARGGATPADVAVTSAAFTFERFAELGEPVSCELALAGPPGGATATFVQAGRALCRAALELTPTGA